MVIDADADRQTAFCNSVKSKVQIANFKPLQTSFRSNAASCHAPSTKNKHLGPRARMICMRDILNQPIVLVLNRNWQPINVRTPQEALCQMAAHVATALDIEGDDQIRPVQWEDWIGLPVRPQDNAVRTVYRAIRIPTVIVAINYARVPMKRPKLSSRGIRERDANRCQYTGRHLRPDEGSLDHILPRSRGGKDTWENLVWASKEVNARKGNRLPHEAGLKLLKAPRAPKELPVSVLIRNAHSISEWNLFVQE
jgi:5-methylcytosine-specific restriction endonuclease McrA